jgi:hypothetical protein
MTGLLFVSAGVLANLAMFFCIIRFGAGKWPWQMKKEDWL